MTFLQKLVDKCIKEKLQNIVYSHKNVFLYFIKKLYLFQESSSLVLFYECSKTSEQNQSMTN